MKNHLMLLLSAIVVLPMNVYAVDKCSEVFAERATHEAFAKGDIYFQERVGQVEEHTLRDKKTATHIYMDAAKDPYMFFSFPAGNSGVGIWFKSPQANATLSAISRPTTLTRRGGLHGARFDMQSEAKKLTIDDSLLGSMRFIRDRELKGILDIKIPPEVQDQTFTFRDHKVIIRRPSLNGLAEYILEIETLGDTRVVRTDSGVSFESPTQVKIRMTGLTSETPLTPVSAEELFKPEALAKMDIKKVMMMSFLVYKEKILAGSPRYDSQFGRDSIYSVNAMFDDLKPEAIENLLMANLNGMDEKTGKVSHERHEGDFVSYEMLKAGKPYKGIKQTIDDRKMIDDSPAFTQLVTRFMTTYPEREADFLVRKDERGIPVKQLIDINFNFVEKSTAAFAAPGGATWKNLLSFLPNELTGDWRDSEEGNARGKRTFGVNAVFVPAALKAISEICANPKSAFYNPERAAKVRSAFEIWNTQAIKLFARKVSAKTLYQRAVKFMKSLGRGDEKLPPPPEKGLDYFAISIDDNGKQNPIIHSDDSLMMMFGSPSAEYLATVSQRVQLPFPYGLRTDVGLVIANPVLAPAEVQKRFGPEKYHGAVIWTVQEDLMQLGLERQLRRTDLPAALKADLQASVDLIKSLRKARNFPGAAEILMIKIVDGKQVVVPFAGDAKGNSNQLWSHLLNTSPE